MMHCPSCGNESSLDQKFCRKCGFNLEPVGRLVAGEAATESVEPVKSEAERLLVRRMFRWLSWGCMVLLVGVILLIINKSFFHAGIFHALASLFLIGGLVVASYGVLSSIIKGTYLPGKTSQGPKQISQNRTTNELPEGRIPVPVPSVTERTTKLISEDIGRKT